MTDALVGHYLALLFIPLGTFGVWQVALLLRPTTGAFVFLVLGTLLYAYGTFYHGTLAFLTGALQSDSIAQQDPALIAYFNDLSEPLGLVLLAGNLGVSGVFVISVAFRKTTLPRWLALYNPVSLQMLLSAVMLIVPHPVRQLLWLTVFNGSLALWYLGITVAATTRGRTEERLWTPN